MCHPWLHSICAFCSFSNSSSRLVHITWSVTPTTYGYSFALQTNISVATSIYSCLLATDMKYIYIDPLSERKEREGPRNLKRIGHNGREGKKGPKVSKQLAQCNVAACVLDGRLSWQSLSSFLSLGRQRGDAAFNNSSDNNNGLLLLNRQRAETRRKSIQSVLGSLLSLRLCNDDSWVVRISDEVRCFAYRHCVTRMEGLFLTSPNV